MAKIKVKIGNCRKARVHSIPCNIHKDGRAPVSQFFEPIIQDAPTQKRKLSTPYVLRSSGKKAARTEDSKYLAASFRGRGLAGTAVPVPKGYTGRIIREDHTVFSDQQERNWTAVHQFDEIMYWNLETNPSTSDPMLAALDWLELAQELHKPASLLTAPLGSASPRRSPRKVPATDYSNSGSPRKL